MPADSPLRGGSGNRAARRAAAWARQQWTSFTTTKRVLRLPKEGLIFIIVTLLIGLAAMNTTTQLLFLVFSMMCAFWILSALLASRSMLGVEVRRQLPRVAVAGEPTRVQIQMRNGKRTGAAYALKVTDELESGDLAGAAFALRITPRTTVHLEYETYFRQRGLWRFRELGYSTRFPFGLIERQILVEQPQELLVIPPVIALSRLRRHARVEIGDHENAARGRGASLYGLRPYQIGESARDIHWRVSARTGELMMKEYESEERRQVTVLIDARFSAERELEFEGAVILAASLCAELAAVGHQVELIAPGGRRVGFGSGEVHGLRCRRALATLARVDAGGTADARLAPSTPDSVVFLVTEDGKRAPSPEWQTLTPGPVEDLWRPLVDPPATPINKADLPRLTEPLAAGGAA